MRSLISAEKQDAVYFPGGKSCNHIQRLDTTTNECETVKLLSFTPRCLAAKNGWICCGGETGEFAAIQLHEQNEETPSTRPADSNDLNLRRALEADSRLPLDFEAFRTEEIGSGTGLSRSSRLSSRLSKNLMGKHVRLARDRVNCVTLWFPQDRASKPSVYNEPVAVLANNDKTVVLLGLTDFEAKEKPEPLDVVTYPDFVNRATLSPDGQLLIAVLDDPFLYVHRRVEKKVDDRNSSRTTDAVEYQWEECNRVLLKSQQRNDRSDSRGSFAACFSSSGSYLAVGTQYGTISVFDTQSLMDPTADPLLTAFTSSRPMTGDGAIRDMAFCPGPYDLLAWTEDRGRVGLADIRTGFALQQSLDIGAEQDFEHVIVLDRNTLDSRFLEGRGERSEYLSPSSSSLAADSREVRRRRNASNAERSGLSPNETAVLEALQSQRRRREHGDRIAARLENPPGHSMIGWLAGGDRASTRPADAAEEDGGISSSAPRAFRDRSQTQRGTDMAERDDVERSSITRALGEWLRDSRDRSHERVRALQRQSERYRQTEQQRAERMAQLQSQRAAAGGRTSNDSPFMPPISSGWGDVEALYSYSVESNVDHLDDDADETETSQRERERERARFLPFINSVAIREMDDRLAAARTRVANSAVHESPPRPDHTAGLSWSQDGRTL